MGASRVGLTTVTAFFEPSPGDLRGFGILLPRKEKFHALGVLFNSDIFWERGEPLRSETYIFPEGLGSLEELLEDRERFQKSAASPLHVEVTSRPKALPLYGLQLEGFLRSNSLQRGRFRLFGNSFGNLGLSRILHQSKALAVELMKEAG